MRGKKNIFADIIFRWLGFVSLPVFSMMRPNLFYILAYHRVSPFNIGNYPFEAGTISAIPEEFEKQIRFVMKRFNVINFSILSDILSSDKILPKNSLIITFDDGYADNYEIAWKILKRYGLTATVFLSTSFIDKKEIFWFDKLTYIIKKIPNGRLVIDEGKHTFKIENGNRDQIRDSMMSLLLTVSNTDRIRLFQQLEQQSNIHILPEHFELAKPLNWSQVLEMSEGGLEIGSHTVTHPFLANLTIDEITCELAESKRVLEEKLGKEIKSIAYPFGNYDHRVMSCAKHCGYQFGVSYEHNVRRFNESELLNMPRIRMEADVSYALFQANLLFPQLFVGIRS
jgi:peptidoglycan/xylan/chitin deacetylase (PgdA/CDA1 family)